MPESGTTVFICLRKFFLFDRLFSPVIALNYSLCVYACLCVCGGELMWIRSPMEPLPVAQGGGLSEKEIQEGLAKCQQTKQKV